MSEAKKDVKFSLKVMVNKEKTKVLFAQVDSSFADVLLSFLTLPLGTIVRILKKHYGDEAPAFGSLTSLYNGLENLDSVNFSTEDAKSIMLHPPSSSYAQAQRENLKLDISDSPPKRRELAKKISQTSSCDDDVFTMSSSSFVINDDLQIFPISAGLLQIASSLCITVTDMDKAEQMTVTFGFAEVMGLLKAMLISSTPLSDIILNKTGLMKSTKRKLQQGITLPDRIENASASNKKKMILRVMIQKSTNKLLYAQAEEDFAVYLFSFLTIPLGGAESLLAGNSLNKCLDCLYRSVKYHVNNYFKTPDAKNKLIELGCGSYSKNHIFSLIAEELNTTLFSSLKLPKGYLKAPATFMVTDDLTVTPFCIVSAVSFLKGMNISVSDVEEVELQIGIKEALGILRASLTSTCALSYGLNLSNHRSHKKVKQEH